MNATASDVHRTPEESFAAWHREGIISALSLVEQRLRFYQEARERRGNNFPVGTVETELLRVRNALMAMKERVA